MVDVVINARFNGPPDSANGGYICGVVAGLLESREARVRLSAPPPLGLPMSWDGSELRHGDTVVAQGARATEDYPPFAADEIPSVAEAAEASRRFTGFQEHPFPTCFGCGPQRDAGDGLRIFAGPVGVGDVFAADWTPDASLAFEGEVPEPVVWAALDCTGGWSGISKIEGTYVLGTMTAVVNHPPQVGAPHVVLGRFLAASGRKLQVASAIYTGAGQLIGQSMQAWIRID